MSSLVVVDRQGAYVVVSGQIQGHNYVVFSGQIQGHNSVVFSGQTGGICRR